MKQNHEFTFRLYVVLDAENSTAAISNLKRICDIYLTGRHHIEVIDVQREPERAMSDGVVMTPTLVKLTPLPERRIFGSLSESRTVLHVLGLPLSND